MSALRLLSTEADDPGRDRPLAAHDPLGPLVEQTLAGNAQAQRTLLASLGPACLRVIRGVLGSHSAEVEDALQESMIALHRALPQFRGECSTTSFACRVAFHTAMNARRKAGYRRRCTPPTSPDQLVEVASGERSPAELAAASSCREALRELLSELPALQAEVLGLHILLGYTIAETATSTQVPADTVRSRLRNALSKLRARIHGDPALRDATGARE